MGASVSGSGYPGGGGPGLPRFGRVSKFLAILHGAVFLVAALGTGLWRPDFAARLSGWLTLTGEGLLAGRLWTLFTYPLLTPDPLGLLFTVLLYWFFGSALEQMLGPARFIRFWLGAVALPPLLAWGLYGVFFGHRRPGFALAGYFVPELAMLAALALLAPSMRILVFFILPVPIRIFAWLSVGAAGFAFLMRARWGAGFVPFAHLIAAGWGWFYLRPLQKVRLTFLRRCLSFLNFRRNKFTVIDGDRGRSPGKNQEYIN